MTFVDPWSAIALSMRVSAIATLISLPLAIGLGYLLARRDFRGKFVVEALVLLPLVLPPVVTGLVLLHVFGRHAWLGSAFAAIGLPLSFSTAAAVLAAAVVGFPLLVRAIRTAFEAVDVRYEDMSRTLGLSAVQTFRRVTLPLAAPGIFAGSILCFARALGEFGATIIVAGNMEGSTRTIALAVYTLLDTPQSDARLVSLLAASIVLSILAVSLHEFLLRRHRRALHGA